MLVLSVIKRVHPEIKQHFISNYPNVEFKFVEGMQEGEPLLHEAEVLITYGEDLSEEKIKQAKHLKWIMVLSAGMDLMPFQAIEKQGIMVTNVRGIHAVPMAEYAISMLLQVSRNTKTLIQQERQHEWNRKVPRQEITGKTMVLLGTGAIAQETARLARAFHMKTIGVSRSGDAVRHFDETYPVKHLTRVLGSADFVVAALPSTPDTAGLLTEDQFERMPPHVIFVNMGRGDLVTNETLLKSVRQHISHAVVDVMEDEPLPENSPLWEEENITITPHISGHSPEYLPRGFELFEKNLERYLEGNGDYINHIDVKRGY
ncbi:D-2-hydroxyacid dehydrogenase [Thalassobacillus sp. CUG 92003]|uniref:D-2-hydroxyacid dehydrogenase n=1 Tax=Thalassobacillus sp. CUG 92003 TaxID=2736641 RepID=UPI0015E6BD67|nr:D-2-hydroxyacid dehydrogenase [Thalassobacillus sp. CUG 92003]